MALFSRPSSRRAPPPPSGPSTTGQLDIMARLLRTWGENAFDIDQVDAQAFGLRCEAWARHLLTGAPAPSARQSAKDDEAPDPQARRRYADLLQELKSHREREQTYVTKTTTGLKGAVWDVVTLLREAASAHARDDQTVSHQLGRLEALLEGDDIRAIRSAAAETVRVVSDNITARQQRDAKQLAALGNRLKSLESSLSEVKSLNRLDPLTGLQNRGALDEALPKMVTMAALSQEPLTMIMVDIDHFKKINDGHGHPAGDAVIKAFADTLVRSFPRKSDFIARYGGEEFCVVLPNAGLKDAERLADRFLDNVRAMEVTHDEAVIRLTASAGIAMVSLTEAPEATLARADRALYKAKESGRDRALTDRSPCGDAS